NITYNLSLHDALPIYEGISKLNLIELYAYNNKKITNVNHMTDLKKLDASDGCGIDDEGISKLNLIELYATDNDKITKKLEKQSIDRKSTRLNSSHVKT